MTPIKRSELLSAPVIGRLDRSISEILWLVDQPLLDEVDANTLDHHADDMIGAGNKIKKVLAERRAVK